MMAVTDAPCPWSAGGLTHIDRKPPRRRRRPVPRAITCAVLIPQGKIAMGKLRTSGLLLA